MSGRDNGTTKPKGELNRLVFGGTKGPVGNKAFQANPEAQALRPASGLTNLSSKISANTLPPVALATGAALPSTEMDGLLFEQTFH
ncbi:MAG: hypothetical protein M9920_04125 [Verrucomicrobiae bacterium]|nr:hypothetical protein [Verrucomicrobiae bacterium]